MKRVLILAFGNTVATTFTGPLDVFHQAGRLYDRLMGGREAPLFEVELLTLDGKTFSTRTGMWVTPHRGIAETKRADLVLVSSLSSLNSERYPGAVDWLKEQAEKGADLASVCTGAFLMAATGILDDKQATTHWAFADAFRARFPAVDLRPERIITDEGNAYCSAGFTAAIDLSLYLVEKYCGREVALHTAKAMVSDHGRISQSPYAVFRLHKDHGDASILEVQTWIEDQHAQATHYPDLARRFGMGS